MLVKTDNDEHTYSDADETPEFAIETTNASLRFWIRTVLLFTL